MAERDSSFGANAGLVDEMYDQYRADPSSVSESWRDFFSDGSDGNGAETAAKEPVQTDTAEVQAPEKAAPRKGQAGRQEDAPPASSGGDSDSAEGQDHRQNEREEEADQAEPIRGAAARIVQNMEASLAVPTATSVRTVPARLLEVNRKVLNGYMGRTGQGKVSFTHLIGYAVVKAVATVPNMNSTFVRDDDQPEVVRHSHVGLGIAVDVEKSDGSRTLLVPCIKDADTLDFKGFWTAYEEIIRRVRNNKISPDDFTGTTISLTNPGTIGTVQSVPRLMPGQAVIVGVGALDYPAEYQGADHRVIADLGLSKVLTVTSTYDHRVIQGAESGLFLQRIHDLLLGADDFYLDVFRAMGVPYEPVRWRRDVNPGDSERVHEEKQVHVQTLINMYRVRGHLIADLDPLRWKEPHTHPELDPATYGLTIWDLDREFFTDGVAGQAHMTLGDLLGVLRDAYCRRIGVEYMHIQEPDQKRWIQEHVEGVKTALGRRAAPHPRPAQRGRGVRALPAHQVRGPQALRAGGRRERHPAHRRDPRPRCPGRHSGGRARHGPPRPPQRAGQHRGQVVPADLPRVRGRHRPRHHPGLGRREVPRWGGGQVRGPVGPGAAARAGVEPVAPRGRRPCRGGDDQGQAGPAERARGVPGAGRCSSTATPPSPARASWPRR